MQELQSTSSSPNNQLNQENATEMKSRLENQVQSIEKSKEAPVSRVQLGTTSFPEITKDVLREYLTLDDKEMMDYSPEVPKMNKVSSGLLAMNQAKAERCIHHLSK